MSHKGSSPRGRGARPACGGWRAGLRIIPAWAGRTRGRGARPRRVRDHPRVGGAHCGGERAPPGHAGSSPRGRGALSECVDGPGECGIIPAWAGRTCGDGDRVSATGDHPRVGGAHTTAPVMIFGSAGSSPRGRGAHVLESRDGRDSGIIPAWAGRTDNRGYFADLAGDHPRVGGAHPPVQRGRPDEFRPGIIPAWAGRTWSGR